MFVKTVIRRLATVAREIKINRIQEASLTENCILVNEKDEIIGSASKRDCHLIPPNKNMPLHRAFSVFLFNTNGELLIHKRSDTKVTFPGYITNSCCSHPLYDIEEEREEKNAVGVKLAAQRRLAFELGIPNNMIALSDFNYLTRILYKSDGDGIWGEYEIDYVLFLCKNLPINPNPDEISDVWYIGKNKFKEFVNNLKDPMTPWFSLLVKTQLDAWWNNLDNLDEVADHDNIHHLHN